MRLLLLLPVLLCGTTAVDPSPPPPPPSPPPPFQAIRPWRIPLGQLLELLEKSDAPEPVAKGLQYLLTRLLKPTHQEEIVDKFPGTSWKEEPDVTAPVSETKEKEQKGVKIEMPKCTVTLFDDWHFNEPEMGSGRFHSDAKLTLYASTGELGALHKAASSIRLAYCQGKAVTFSSDGEELPFTLTDDDEVPWIGPWNDRIDAVHIKDKVPEETGAEAETGPAAAEKKEEVKEKIESVTPPIEEPKEETKEAADELVDNHHDLMTETKKEEKEAVKMAKPRCTVTLFDDWHFNEPEMGNPHFHSNAKLILAQSSDDLGILSKMASSIRLRHCQGQTVTFSAAGEEIVRLTGDDEVKWLGRWNDQIDAVHIGEKEPEVLIPHIPDEEVEPEVEKKEKGEVVVPVEKEPETGRDEHMLEELRILRAALDEVAQRLGELGREAMEEEPQPLTEPEAILYGR